MDMKDVKRVLANERRNIRINIRITPSQNKFIITNNLSITKIMNEALKQLGYIPLKPEELPEEDKDRGYKIEKEHRHKILKIRKHGYNRKRR